MRTAEEQEQVAILAAAMKAIRKARRMRASEVARALDMPLRSYEHFESGRGRITYDRLVRFAKVTNSDPIAIIASISLNSPEFALHCIDNKMMTILMIAVSELNETLGADITFLEPGILISAFTKLFNDLGDHVAKRDLFAEMWLREKGPRIAGIDLSELASRKRATE